MAPAVHIPVTSLQSRLRFLERTDAIRHLQLIGRNREANLLRAGVINEISRLRSEMRRASPWTTGQMGEEVRALVTKLKSLPEYPDHPPMNAIHKTKR